MSSVSGMLQIHCDPEQAVNKYMIIHDSFLIQCYFTAGIKAVRYD